MTGPIFVAIGGIYVLNIIMMGVATLILGAIAVWGIEPRRRWRAWRDETAGTLP